LASIAARAVEALGGRYSTELGIDVDRDEKEIEQWSLPVRVLLTLCWHGKRSPGLPTPEVFKIGFNSRDDEQHNGEVIYEAGSVKGVGDQVKRRGEGERCSHRLGRRCTARSHLGTP
jgi:hypothetical protein